MIKIIKTTILSLCVFGLALTSCNMDLGERGNGQIVTEEYSDIGSFNEVSIAGSFEVVLRESNQPNLILITDENLLNYIEIDNNNGRLEVNSTRKLRPSDDSRIIVEYTELEMLDVSGAAAVSAENTLEGNSFELNMSGAGEVELKLDLKELIVDVSGAGAVSLSGFAQRQEISMSGAGGYDGDKLESESAEISISGVGGASIFVTKELNASVSGVGGVSYKGNPEVVNKNVSGLGSVSQDDDQSM
jgi:hypothetical protein